ncbi:SGNH/GDSL hydrolase family protein [Aestuariivivens sp. NBU2969]|uniref:SGNH/GDSL hydrolase family protein n=1 Tax=Aestuariivivens sp. NBU2969 TaxID=2873267 RepID=UPI001CBE4D03|nr:SGNH/GDSL hydrolase family protein [Aestuariivivens sp. NBU2969]
MKNTIGLLFLCCVMFSCTSSNSEHNGEVKNENTEWSRTWLVNTNDTILPKVLIVGDSHVERYYEVIAKKIGDKVSCSKFTTSKSLGDPVFIKQLESVLTINNFDIITFNNGLHGGDYSIEEYGTHVSIVNELLKQNAKDAVVWVNITAIREKNNLSQFAKRNDQIIERNKFLFEFTQKNNVPLIDFYSETADELKYYSNDGIHFNDTGVAKEADLITEYIHNILISQKFSEAK